MKKRLTITLLLLIAGSIAMAQTGVRKGPIVRRVDRILIESSDPKALFAFFSADLQLPEAEPFTKNRDYMSGALGAGNVNIEIYRYLKRGVAPMRKPSAAHFAGLALEPHPLAEALRELKVREILYGPLQPTFSTLPDGTKGVVWTIVPLPAFSKSGMSVFLYEYSQAFLKVDVRRKQLGNRLTLNNGGPLGIQSVREVVTSAANFKQETAAWQKLLGPPAASGHWSVGTGPSIQIIPGPRDSVQKIVIRVQSLAQAKAFLKNRNLLGSGADQEIFINPSKIQGLSISLVE